MLTKSSLWNYSVMEYFHIPLAHLSYGSHAGLKALYYDVRHSCLLMSSFSQEFMCVQEVWVCMILSTEIHGDQTQDVCDYRVQKPKIFGLDG